MGGPGLKNPAVTLKAKVI